MTTRRFVLCDWCRQATTVPSPEAEQHWLGTHPCEGRMEDDE